MIGVVRYERIDPRTAPRSPSTSRTPTRAAASAPSSSSTSRRPPASAASRRFVADVLPANRKMLRVFEDAGYVVDHEFDDGVVRLAFDLEPTENSLAVTYAREHRAEARSVRRLLRPRSVAVVGASRSRALGRATPCCATSLDGGFTGDVHAVNPTRRRASPGCRAPATVASTSPATSTWPSSPCRPSTSSRSCADCADKAVRGLVVVSRVRRDRGARARERQRRLVALARG